MKALGIGEAVIDRVRLEKITDTGEHHVIATERHIGGVPTAALVILARLGADCTLITTVGQDSGAKIIERDLEIEGIKVVLNRADLTKINTMVVDSTTGHRIGKIRSKVRHRPIKNIDPDLIKSADVIVVDRHEPEAFKEVVRHKRPDAKIVIDPSAEFSDHTVYMVSQAECPIVPIEFLVHLSPEGLTPALEELFDLCNRPCIVTVGELGSLLYDGNTVDIVPPVEIEAVDSTGAGDVYRGAFAYGAAKGWNPQKSAAFANSVAAAQCAEYGNLTAIPSSAVLQSLADRPVSGDEPREVSIASIEKRYWQLATTFSLSDNASRK